MDIRLCTFSPPNGRACGAPVDDPLLFCLECMRRLHQYDLDHRRVQQDAAIHAAGIANGVITPYVYRATTSS
jgi:hypothetical protein